MIRGFFEDDEKNDFARRMSAAAGRDAKRQSLTKWLLGLNEKENEVEREVRETHEEGPTDNATEVSCSLHAICSYTLVVFGLTTLPLFALGPE